tara:strand:+ start:405 stop:704 length:300 start_codon:yes stop_codon:yes gene_type:complete
MARKKSWRSGEIKSIQTFSYQDSSNANGDFTLGINAVDLSHSFVGHTSAYDSGNSNPITSTRQVYLNSTTQLVGQARNSGGSGSSLFTAGAGQVVEFYA